MKKVFRKIIVLGIPLLFGQLTVYFQQIADSAMMGHFGEQSLELAAIGIAGLFTWVLNTCLWPMSVGVQALYPGATADRITETKRAAILRERPLITALLPPFTPLQRH